MVLYVCRKDPDVKKCVKCSYNGQGCSLNIEVKKVAPSRKRKAPLAEIEVVVDVPGVSIMIGYPAEVRPSRATAKRVKTYGKSSIIIYHFDLADLCS